MKATILAPILAIIFASVAVALPLVEQEQSFTQVYQDQNTGLYYEFDDETQEYFQVDPASLDFYPADEEAAANFQAAVEAEEGEYFDDDVEEDFRPNAFQAMNPLPAAVAAIGNANQAANSAAVYSHEARGRSDSHGEMARSGALSNAAGQAQAHASAAIGNAAAAEGVAAHPFLHLPAAATAPGIMANHHSGIANHHSHQVTSTVNNMHMRDQLQAAGASPAHAKAAANAVHPPAHFHAAASAVVAANRMSHPVPHKKFVDDEEEDFEIEGNEEEDFEVEEDDNEDLA